MAFCSNSLPNLCFTLLFHPCMYIQESPTLCFCLSVLFLFWGAVLFGPLHDGDSTKIAQADLCTSCMNGGSTREKKQTQCLADLCVSFTNIAGLSRATCWNAPQTHHSSHHSRSLNFCQSLEFAHSVAGRLEDVRSCGELFFMFHVHCWLENGAGLEVAGAAH